jgi:hypothetical protein
MLTVSGTVAAVLATTGDRRRRVLTFGLGVLIVPRLSISRRVQHRRIWARFWQHRPRRSRTCSVARPGPVFSVNR